MKHRTRRASRVSRMNKNRAFWRKSAIGLQPQRGVMDAGSLDRSLLEAHKHQPEEKRDRT
jgi:hypothetical protein